MVVIINKILWPYRRNTVCVEATEEPQECKILGRSRSSELQQSKHSGARGSSVRTFHGQNRASSAAQAALFLCNCFISYIIVEETIKNACCRRTIGYRAGQHRHRWLTGFSPVDIFWGLKLRCLSSEVQLLGYFGAGHLLIKWPEQIGVEAMTTLWSLQALKWTLRRSEVSTMT